MLGGRARKGALARWPERLHGVGRRQRAPEVGSVEPPGERWGGLDSGDAAVRIRRETEPEPPLASSAAINASRFEVRRAYCASRLSRSAAAFNVCLFLQNAKRSIFPASFGFAGQKALGGTAATFGGLDELARIRDVVQVRPSASDRRGNGRACLA